MKKKIYLDNASTTPISKEVFAEMVRAIEASGNANSLHTAGQKAAAFVDSARDHAAALIGAKRDELFFTSGGTESNNWAILGLARANRQKGNHVVTSMIEHPSVLEACAQLEKEGFEVTYIKPNEDGIVPLREILHAIKHETILISIMAVNNEVGTIQTIKAISQTAHESGILFHTDATQAVGTIAIDVHDMNIDALSFSAHKIHGPQGVGALFVKHGVKIENLHFGGEQEHGKRGGTMNVAGIAGFGKACEILIRDWDVIKERLQRLSKLFKKLLKKNIDSITFNGNKKYRASHILNVSFDMIENEAILMLLDLEGVEASISSACTSGVSEQSHVLKAMGVSSEIIKSSIRFSFSKHLLKSQIVEAVEIITNVVSKLRKMSPVTKAGRRKEEDV